MIKIKVNDKVRVSLTKIGANTLNQKNKELLELVPRYKNLVRTDYKAGDIYEDQLYEIIHVFAVDCFAGGEIPFNDLEKVK